MIKTTAGFSSGGSGGGLFDSRGRLIGITTFFSAGHSGSYYALPSDWLHNLRKRNAEEVNQISGLTLWEKDLPSNRCSCNFRNTWKMVMFRPL